MTALFSKIAVFFLSIIMMFSGYPKVSSYEVRDESGLKMSFVAIADTHIQGDDSTQSRNLMRGIRDMEAAKVQPDALTIVGDLTMNGQSVEYFFLYSALTSSFKIPNIILAAGNHDICIKEDNYDKASSRFTSYFNMLTGRDVDCVYYSTVVKGYYFIVLGSEEIAGTNQSFSEEQLNWLRYTLDQAALNAPGKPVFIINHNPLAGTNNVDTYWPIGGTAGEQSDDIMDIIQQYENVYFFSGHLHAPLENSGAVTVGNVTFVDLPAYNYGDDSGMGYVVEVYEDTVELRARNFVTSQWLDYTFKFNIT